MNARINHINSFINTERLFQYNHKTATAIFNEYDFNLGDLYNKKRLLIEYRPTF